MVLTVKKEVPVLPKGKGKAKALKSKKMNAPRRHKLDHCAIIKFSLTTQLAMKSIEDNTLVFTVDVKANKHQIKDTVKKFYYLDVANVNTQIRPDGKKKAYV
ncbi:60S ribosomal protein L23a-like [Panthera tigris]|uniref:60S ribosomal protein L23a-like n=1 Tax=Panthera tigris TaxID=9694 RepID=UPI001C6F88D7|nr:60S ribosomal protein L23a-like [Panthera tigris]